MTSRRRFIQIVPIAGAALLAARGASAALVDEKDASAVALGYVSDATKADKTKHPNYAEGQHCGVCQLYQGQAGAASGPCPLFAGKEVSANGWCSSFVKKPG